MTSALFAGLAFGVGVLTIVVYVFLHNFMRQKGLPMAPTLAMLVSLMLASVGLVVLATGHAEMAIMIVGGYMAGAGLSRFALGYK